MNSNDNLKSIELLSNGSRGYISTNTNLYNDFINSKTTKLILNKAMLGIPLIQLGNKNPKVMIVSGIHGNELPSQSASIHLINHLNQVNIKGTVYIIPFASPESTMYNIRNFRGYDLNRSAMIKDSITNNIIKKSENLKVEALADFHSTGINANPGREGVFSSRNPTFESVNIASFISKEMLSSHFGYNEAGVQFRGALEDESNIRGIPAVTCEVISKNGYIEGNSREKSFLQMLTFLTYFNII